MAVDAPVEAGEVGERLARVRSRIAAAGGAVERVRIVAVTKGFDVGAIEAARRSGLVDVGENYPQELERKRSILTSTGRESSDDAVSWHLIGVPQSNKIRRVAPLVDCWQAVDRLDTGRAIGRAAPGARVYVQVNVTAEPTKSGCSPDAAPALVASLHDLGLHVEGLMTVGPARAPDRARRAFAALATLADALGLRERSMGMSDDFEIAVGEGATVLRLGTALFGPRLPVSDLRR